MIAEAPSAACNTGALLIKFNCRSAWELKPSS